MIEYNKMIVYDYSNNHFQVYCVIPYLNLPPVPIGDSYRPNKIVFYTPDPLTDDISIDSGNYVINFTTPHDSPKVTLLTSDATETDHVIMIDKPVHATAKRGY